MDNSVYNIQQIDKSCWRIDEGMVRSFLVIGNERALLIDSGFGAGDIKKVIENLTELPIVLVNTHVDRDHIGCNLNFDAAYMHPSEYERYYQRIGQGAKTKPLWEGEEIDLGGRVLEVILIPGHTPGSIALLDRQNRILFGGDSVQSGTIYMFGEGRDIRAYIASMTKLSSLSEHFDLIYPSHGALPVKSDIIEKLIIGATKIMNKEVEGTKPQHIDVSALEYDVEAAKFLY